LYHTDADAGSTWVPGRGGLKAFTLFPLLRMPLTLHQLTSKETAVAEHLDISIFVPKQFIHMQLGAKIDFQVCFSY
jgi:hypothetical protein